MGIYTEKKRITQQHINRFKEIVGNDCVLFDEQSRIDYGHDETEHLSFLPEIILLPHSSSEISEILKICNEALIPVTPRGAGTRLIGGA